MAASLSLFASCGGGEEPTMDNTDNMDVEVPSQDEADKAAADAINEENAEEELDSLLNDIGE